MVYNWTAGHADRGLAGNVKRQLELQAIEALKILILLQRKYLRLTVCRKRRAKGV